MTTLFAIGVLAQVVGNDVNQSMLPIVLRMASDKVPNVRFNVAKTLQILIGLVDSTVTQSRIKPTLTKMQDDTDRDVKFYASQAVQLC